MLNIKSNTKNKSVCYENKNKIEHTASKINDLYLEYLQVPEHYSKSSIKDICKEINNVADAHGSNVGQIYNTVYRSLSKGGVETVKGGDAISLVYDMSCALSNKMNLNEEEFESFYNIRRELMMFINSGMFSISEGIMLLYSHTAIDVGLFENEEYSYIFNLKKPLKNKAGNVYIVFLICASSEESLHFLALKTSCLLKTQSKKFIQLVQSNKNDVLMESCIDWERNIDIFRKFLIK